MRRHDFDQAVNHGPPLPWRAVVATLLLIAVLGWNLVGDSASEIEAAEDIEGLFSETEAAPPRRSRASAENAAGSMVEAAESGDIERVEELLGRGIDANSRDATGKPALLAAVIAGQTDIARKLLAAGARLEAGTGATCSELHWAAMGDDGALIELLLVAGASVDARAIDRDDSTALHFASGGGHEASVAALLRARAAPDALDTHGFTPLAHAALLGRGGVVSRLIRHGCDVHRTDPARRTALHLAAAAGDESCVRELLDGGADANAIDAWGWSALHYAAAHGRAALVAMLAKSMQRSALDARSICGRSALHLAARRGESSCVAALLQAGLDPAARDLDGRSVRDFAPRELRGEPWSRLGSPSPEPVAVQSRALLDFEARRPSLVVCTRETRKSAEPKRLLDLAIWGDGATVFSLWNAGGPPEFMAGVLSAKELSCVFRDLNETGWLDAPAPRLDPTRHDCVEITIARKTQLLRREWDDVQAVDLVADVPNRAVLADWSLGWDRARDVLRSARPRSAQAMHFVLVRGEFRGLTFEDGASASWMK